MDVEDALAQLAEQRGVLIPEPDNNDEADKGGTEVLRSQNPQHWLNPDIDSSFSKMRLDSSVV